MPLAIVLYTAFIADSISAKTPIAERTNLGFAISLRVISVITASEPSLAIKIPATLNPATSLIVFFPARIISPFGSTARNAIT